MATSIQNLSECDPKTIPDVKGIKIGIVVSDWNNEITYSLLHKAVKTLIYNNVEEINILVKHVPGSFELVAGAKYMAENSDVESIICLGCVIKGETPHFDYICQGVTNGIIQLNINFKIPFIFGVLTTNNFQQAKDRSGGKHGNKGDEAAITAIKMIAMHRELKSN